MKKAAVIGLVVLTLLIWWWTRPISSKLASSEATKASPIASPTQGPKAVPTEAPVVINKDTDLVKEMEKLKPPALDIKISLPE